MRVGVPKEIKDQEYRVGLIPSSVSELTKFKHTVLVEQAAGVGAGFSDADYIAAGAKMVATAEEIFKTADLIVKVKEPQPEECRVLRQGQVIFTFLHLAPDPAQTALLLASGCTGIAYETVMDMDGNLPLLMPMSEIAGCLSIQEGAYYLEKFHGGSGILLERIPGVLAAKVVVLGGGVAGTEAIRVAVGMGAEVTVLDKSMKRLRALDQLFGARLNTCYANAANIEAAVKAADLVIGAVLVPGAATPKIVTSALLGQMRKGSVVVDIAIDQGGCFESSRPTTHANPTYLEAGVVHYCVSNMPSSVSQTASIALNHATLPFVLELAEKGYRKACLENSALGKGVNVHEGHITHPAVALALQKPYTPPESVLRD